MKERTRMADIARRYEKNPILKPRNIPPSADGLRVECLLNPGAFRFQDKTWLLLRVAERPLQTERAITLPVFEDGKIRILSFDRNDPDLIANDPRTIFHRGQFYLTTLSHLRLVSSDDGIHFGLSCHRPFCGTGPLESYGIEDCRVCRIEDRFYLTYTAVSGDGFGVGMMSTADWTSFSPGQMIIPGPNKDCALFEEKINGRYCCLHRPVMGTAGGHNIWLAASPDMVHWGHHRCIARTRPGMWDSERIGAGASPIKTDKGWLEIYHGADHNSRYCLGAMLLDLEDPSRVLARSREPIMEPIMPYEQTGFFGNVVFTNGHIIDGDTITLYYGASDEVICMARFSIREILSTLDD
jgi:predicted GH43/DUF377 family glycosyl hydrolase